MVHLRIYFISLIVASAAAAHGQAGRTAEPACSAALAALFAPAQPQLGTYTVCTSEAALPTLARTGWRTETVAPADAFGSAGSYDRARLARVYGGRRATVARGFIEFPDYIESVTLISPYPDASLATLQSGTMIIRHIVPRL